MINGTTLSDAEVLEHYENMVEIFGDELPNMEQEPIRFAHYVKMYKHFYLEQDTTQDA